MSIRTSSRKPAATVSTTRSKEKTADALAAPVGNNTPKAVRGRVKRSKEVLCAPATDAFIGSKQAGLIAMLRTPAGASIDQIMIATGWQAHTVRGTISGVLRKRLGLNVICEPTAGSGVRRYRIAESAVA